MALYMMWMQEIIDKIIKKASFYTNDPGYSVRFISNKILIRRKVHG